MTNNKLLPCPFCNSKDIIVYKWQMSSFWSVECSGEGCPMSYVLRNLFESEEKAISFWNVRYAKEYDPSFHHLEELEKY